MISGTLPNRVAAVFTAIPTLWRRRPASLTPSSFLSVGGPVFNFVHG